MTEIDRDDTLGLGKDVVLSGDVNADSFFVVRPQGGQITTLTLRVHYPLGIRRQGGIGTDRRPECRLEGSSSCCAMASDW